MKAGFFVMVRENGEIHTSPQYEMMEEFFCRTRIPFEEKQWNVNFFEFQTEVEAKRFIILRNRVGIRTPHISLKGNPAYDLMM